MCPVTADHNTDRRYWDSSHARNTRNLQSAESALAAAFSKRQSDRGSATSEQQRVRDANLNELSKAQATEAEVSKKLEEKTKELVRATETKKELEGKKAAACAKITDLQTKKIPTLLTERNTKLVRILRSWVTIMLTAATLFFNVRLHRYWVEARSRIQALVAAEQAYAEGHPDEDVVKQLHLLMLHIFENGNPEDLYTATTSQQPTTTIQLYVIFSDSLPRSSLVIVAYGESFTAF